MKKIVFIVLCLFAFYGCVSSTFTSIPEGAQIYIGKTDISGQAPVDGRVPRTTFGKYPVKITKQGSETLYGILPLTVSGGVIFADILVFAPATFFNVQGPFAYYEFDLQRNIIKYKSNPGEDWMEYKIPSAQRERAMKFYGELSPLAAGLPATASGQSPQLSPTSPAPTPAKQTDPKE